MRNWRKLISIATLVVVLILLADALVNAQTISDWFRLRGYTAPADIVKISAEDKLSPKAQHILYVTHPILDSSAEEFSSQCPQSEQTIVLGCYHSGATPFSSGSYLYVKSVNDPRLKGVEEVTTAHEMLHAAYDRLSSKKKDQVDQMLMDFYNHGLKDQRILDTINSYKQTEPDDVVNEMHSIFGTEVTDLPAPLESYYKQYFSDRTAVTALAQSYEGEFTRRNSEIKADDAQLAQYKIDIEALEAQLQNQLASIENDRASAERSNDPAAINDYNSRVAAYNSGVRLLRAKIIAYNQLVDQRNEVASELRSLQNSLSSKLSTQ
jgi:hypothetical protein